MWGRSVERSCGPMHKNRIEGVAGQGERARDHKALVTKGRRCKFGGRAVKECVLTWGDLALCLKGQRRSRSEKSAEAIVVCSLEQTKGRTRRSGSCDGDVLEMASDVRIGGTVQKGRGEAGYDLGSDEGRCPRLQAWSTGKTSTSRTAGCGPAYPLVWEGRAGNCSPYPDCLARVMKRALA